MPQEFISSADRASQPVEGFDYGGMVVFGIYSQKLRQELESSDRQRKHQSQVIDAVIEEALNPDTDN